MKNVMFIGSSTCGKTTLCQRLNDQEIGYKKTQAIEVINSTIDTPGEYLENRALYKALIVTAADADLVVFVQDATDERFRFSPGHAFAFNKPVIGVVSKADIATTEQVEQAKELLELTGAPQIFVTSAVTGEGCEPLKEFIMSEEAIEF